MASTFMGFLSSVGHSYLIYQMSIMPITIIVEKMISDKSRVNPRAMTITKPWRENGRTGDLNQRPSGLRSQVLHRVLTAKPRYVQVFICVTNFGHVYASHLDRFRHLYTG